MYGKSWRVCSSLKFKYKSQFRYFDGFVYQWSITVYSFEFRPVLIFPNGDLRLIRQVLNSLYTVINLL